MLLKGGDHDYFYEVSNVISTKYGIVVFVKSRILYPVYISISESNINIITSGFGSNMCACVLY